MDFNPNIIGQNDNEKRKTDLEKQKTKFPH